MKKSERTHIDDLKDRWPRALAAASLSIRQNPKLLGLDKIRDGLAIYAALHATGYPDRPGFVIPHQAGEPTQNIQDIVDAAFADAVEPVRAKLQVAA